MKKCRPSGSTPPRLFLIHYESGQDSGNRLPITLIISSIRYPDFHRRLLSYYSIKAAQFLSCCLSSDYYSCPGQYGHFHYLQYFNKDSKTRICILLMNHFHIPGLGLFLVGLCYGINVKCPTTALYIETLGLRW